jgi:FkbM family methyltransferase
VYSFGIGGDITFDSDMAGLFACDVFMFDPSPSVAQNFKHFNSGQRCGRGRLYFEPLGLGPVSDKEIDAYKLIIEGKTCPARNLADIARAHEHTHIDVLKIDIEGGEFAALKQVLATNTLASLQVNQLLVEFHLLDDACFKDFIHIIGMLQKQGYLLFRKEFNPYVADKCAEFAFAKKASGN